MTAPSMGLERGIRERLAQRVTTILHSAASVSFTLPPVEAREINLEGTRRMLEFAELARERGGLECYGHVSTAYVAGTHRGRFYERVARPVPASRSPVAPHPGGCGARGLAGRPDAWPY